MIRRLSGELSFSLGHAGVEGLVGAEAAGCPEPQAPGALCPLGWGLAGTKPAGHQVCTTKGLRVWGPSLGLGPGDKGHVV